MYFLALVIFQGKISPSTTINYYILNTFSVFPVFGAASAQTAMLPLVFVITVTAIKDGVEDYRRATLDEEVNTSAATKLGNWRNVNIATDPRPWFEKLLGLNPPNKITKGVRKLREKEGAEGNRIMLTRGGVDDVASVVTTGPNDSTWTLGAPHGAGGRRLDDIASMDEHSYPPGDPNKSSMSMSMSAASKPSVDMGGQFGQIG